MKTMQMRLGSIFCVGAILCLVGCAKSFDRERVGAVAGAAVGAGLGAIIGNQAGSTASGLTLGAIAGMGTGVLVARSLAPSGEAAVVNPSVAGWQSPAVATIDPAQDKIESALQSDNALGATALPVDPQRKDLAHLYARAHPMRETEVLKLKRARAARREKAKQVARLQRNGARGASAEVSALQHEILEARKQIALSDKIENPQVVVQTEPGVPSTEAAESAKAAYDWRDLTPPERGGEAAAPTVSDCDVAQSEIAIAEGLQGANDKLFHFRRALRLCPNNVQYHQRMSQFYSTVERPLDAQYEDDVVRDLKKKK